MQYYPLKINKHLLSSPLGKSLFAFHPGPATSPAPQHLPTQGPLQPNHYPSSGPFKGACSAHGTLSSYQPTQTSPVLSYPRVTLLLEACKHRGRWFLQPLPLLPVAHGLGRATQPFVLPRAVPLPTFFPSGCLPLRHHPHLPAYGVWVCMRGVVGTRPSKGYPGWGWGWWLFFSKAIWLFFSKAV